MTNQKDQTGDGPSLYPDCTPAPIDNLTNMVGLLRWRALNQSERPAYIFLRDAEGEEARITYGELDQSARAFGAWLQSMGAQGERVLLLYPPGLDYLCAFFGCLYAGAVAVPAYPPRLNQSLWRIQSIAADARPAVVLTNGTVWSRIEKLLGEADDLKALRWINTDEADSSLSEAWREEGVEGTSLALLQYTSGSTAAPRGVMVSHENLWEQERLIRHAFGQTEQSIIVSWLPLYHDMGLIGSALQAPYTGALCILMSPASFLQRPFSWLQALTRYRATTSGGPNFAFDLCVRRITTEQRAQLDLSTWSVAFNGAETLRAETLERFAETFEPCGFQRRAFRPCYGLAEATLLVSVNADDAGPIMCQYDAAALQHHSVVEAREDSSEHARTLVGAGSVVSGSEVLIVNPETLGQCAQDEVGEVWVAGPTVAQGYWNRPSETAQTFQAHLSDKGAGPFLRTGDMGFLRAGELFITGRLKDMIIVRGHNLYPQDIELTVEKSHPSLRAGAGAAFSLDIEGDERLAVVHELDQKQKPDIENLIEKIRRDVAEEHEVQVYALTLIKPGTIPKTSSGKIQRAACREQFLKGNLSVLSEWRSLPAAAAASDAESETVSLRDADEIEAFLTGQVAASLHLSETKIDIHQPIVNYGLDSLAATELIHSIEMRLGTVLRVTDFLQGVSIAQLAAQCLERLSETEPAITGPALVHQAGGRGALSHGQRALWFLYKVAPESTAYNIVAGARISTPLDVPALQSTLQELVNRHPSLRTNFTTQKGEPLASVQQHAELSFHVEDATDWNEARLNDRMVAESHRPFNLEHDPLLRVTLFQRGKDEHVLLIVVHHIVADFWSLAVMLDELDQLYRASQAGTKIALPELTLDYGDYVRWQTDLLAGASGERLWSYWQRQLAGELPLLQLPTDRPRPAVQTYRGFSHFFELSEELTARCKALGQVQQATLYMTLLAAFMSLLSRYTGQDELLVGSPTAGRSRAELSGLVGYFVNPVVLRARLEREMSFESFLVRVRETVLAALEHQEYPFALLVERLQPQRDTSLTPLFQAMFVLQKSPLPEQPDLPLFALNKAGAKSDVGGLQLESVTLERQVSQFDLTLMMAEVNERLVGSFKYNADLFDARTIERMALHFRILLESIVASPSRPVSTLPLLLDQERSEILFDWNETSIEVPYDKSLHQLFEEQAARTPDNLALVYEQERLTFDALNRRSNQLAHHLQKLGVGPEARVGICMERSALMLVAVLGILKSGAAYVPLDPSQPTQRLAFMLHDAGVEVLLTQQRLAQSLPEFGGRLLSLDAQLTDLADESEANLSVTQSPRNLAYLIYTSGSTGKPKGVMIEHRSVVNLWRALHLAIYSKQHPAASRVGLNAPLSFDASVKQLVVLLHGATLFILPEEVRTDGRALLSYIERNQLDALDCTPSHLNLWLATGVFERMSANSLLFLIGGEPISETLWHTLASTPHINFYNLYGPTECTVDATCCEGRESPARATIGRPLANTNVYLLDSQLQPVPIGVAGEVHLAGAGVARGYLGQPALTAQSFIPHPYSAEPGARLYKTGDLARYLPDGNIELLGRLDQQIKLRGYRIELGEIEAALAQHQDVEAQFVTLYGDEPDEQRLVAYVVSHPASKPGTNELRSFLKQSLPDYMLPNAFVVLDQLPLTSNGKIDRRALPPPPDQARPELDADFVSPNNSVEKILADIWAQVLGLEQVGIYDNFFELGGHSLLATELISQLQDIFPTEVPLLTLFFEDPTVAGLAAAIVESQGEQNVENIVATLEHLGQLTDEEVERMLSEGGTGEY
jgi:amino acid adenylation domain-containing protein